jgi:ABC-2 type transport system permease protein
MNIINTAFLKLALLPSGIYARMGIDKIQLSAILHTKLMMDDRRPGSLRQTTGRKNSKPVSLATLGTMFLSGIMGLVYLFAFSIGHDRITQLTLYFSMFFLMLSATLISDFTSVLIDIRDNYIILTKPVSDRTFLAARLLHIFIHICKLVLPMSLPGLVYMVYTTGAAAGSILLLMILFLTFFAIFFINAVYLLMLRITTPQKFQSIISYVQIIFAILIYGGFQLVPRMVGEIDFGDFDISTRSGIFFYPIYWFACTWNLLYTLHANSPQLVAAVLGLILPFAGLSLMVRYLAPAFNAKLAMISSSAVNNPPPRKAGKETLKGPSYSGFLSRVFTKGQAERMGFLFTWKMTARSRDFKMKVYPSIGYLIVYVVIMFMNKHVSIREIAEQESPGKLIIISALYFTSLLLTMAINQVVYSDQYKASWIYYVSPLERPGEVILGGAKAAIFKFYIPMVFFITIAGIVIVGPAILPNIVLGLFNELLIASILVYAGNKVFPFSVHQNTSVKTGSLMRSLFVFFISMVIATGHYLIYDMKPAVILCAVLSVIATWLLMGAVKNISWERIRERMADDG